MTKPVLPSARIIEIDILRGFALVGILWVNTFGYNSSFFNFSGFYTAIDNETTLNLFTNMVTWGADKFIFIFSLLFGFSAFLLSQKFTSEKAFTLFYIKRMLILFLFGFVHVFFFWAGDILILYSIIGIILILIRRLPDWLLVVLSILFYFFICIYIPLQESYPFILPQALSTDTTLTLPEVIKIYSTGNYFECLQLRLTEYNAIRNMNIFYYAPKVLALFIIGYLIGKKQIIQSIRINNWWGILLIVFIMFGLFFGFKGDQIPGWLLASNSRWINSLYMGVYEAGNLFIGFSYCLIILLACRTVFFTKVLTPLKYYGRMALTNYIFQSIFFTFVSYGYGLGYFGTTNMVQPLLIALSIVIIQMVFSYYWLKNFRFGPLEFIWRRLSYKTMKP